MEHDRPSEIPSALLGGRLEGISLPDLLWSLCRRQSTGVLKIKQGDFEKSVCVERGQIVFASSSDPDDRLGERFLRDGLVTIEQLEDAISKLGTGKRLGTLLVEAGSLQAGELVQGVLSQVESIVLDLFEWESGDYRFEEALPTEEMIKLEIKTGELLLRGIRQLRSFTRVRRSVGPTQKIYGLTDEWESLLEGVTLTAGEESLVEHLAEGEASLEALCREVFLSNFEIYQTIWALKVLDVVEERDELWMAPSDVTVHGSLDQIDFTELLVSLARSDESGVLYVTHGERERSFHIADGRCVFATSNNPDDGLMAYLLRRGVISLRDREETAKRLLSNKRVGAILRDLGVLDQQDLETMVRDQLSEIVYDTFRWNDAQYAFMPGPLPTVEEITLEADLDALVAGGIRRVGSWSRVWNGCGGMDVTLELKPTYLNVLDAMSAGPEEWEVIAALKQPRTPHQVCLQLDIGDYRVCQILWTLRVLGGVEVVAGIETPAEAPVRTAAEATDAADEADVPAEQPRSKALLTDDQQGRPLVVDQAIEQAIIGMERDLEDEPAGMQVDTTALDDPASVSEQTTFEAVSDAKMADLPEVEVDYPDSEEERLEEARDVASVSEREMPEEEVREEEPADRLHDQRPAESTIGLHPPADDAGSEPPLDATQVIPREVVEAAVTGGAPGEEDEAFASDAEARPDPPVGDPEVSTMKLDREAVDEALGDRGTTEPELATIADSDDDRAPADDPPQEPEQDEWDVPPEVDQAIARFNAAQRVVYRTIRAEVGAGAANFIRSCCSRLDGMDADVVAGVDLNADGSWEAQGLRDAVRRLRPEDPWELYQRLIDSEIDQLRVFIGDARAVELQREVELVEQPDVSR